jgi:hypothetical protein
MCFRPFSREHCKKRIAPHGGLSGQRRLAGRFDEVQRAGVAHVPKKGAGVEAPWIRQAHSCDREAESTCVRIHGIQVSGAQLVLS